MTGASCALHISATSRGRGRTPACASAASAASSSSTRPSRSARRRTSTSSSRRAATPSSWSRAAAPRSARTSIIDALMFAHKAAQPLIDLQEKLRAAVGKPKREFVPPAKDPVIVERVAGIASDKIAGGDGDPREARALRGARRCRQRDARGADRRVPRAAARGERGVRVGEEEEPARAGAGDRQAHRRPRARPTSAPSPARSASCRARTARRCSRAARPRRW